MSKFLSTKILGDLAVTGVSELRTVNFTHQGSVVANIDNDGQLFKGSDVYYHGGNLTTSIINALNVNATTLDGLDSLKFLRKDIGGTVTGDFAVEKDASLVVKFIADINNNDESKVISLELLQDGGYTGLVKGVDLNNKSYWNLKNSNVDYRYMDIEFSTTPVVNFTNTPKVGGTGTILHTGNFAEPSACTGLVLTENASFIDITFDITAAKTNATSYEVWASVGDELSWDIIKRLNSTDIVSTDTLISVADTTYNAKTTIYYKVYAFNNGLKSAALSGSILLLNDALDVTNVKKWSDGHNIFISYDIPNDNRIADVYIKKHADITTPLEASAVEIYRGNGSFVVYPIPDIDIDLVHNFWIYTTTIV